MAARPRETDAFLPTTARQAFATSRGGAGGRADLQFDPAQPVPTIGGNISSGGGILLQGAWTRRRTPGVERSGADSPFRPERHLVFQTDPLTEDMEVTGPLQVKL